MSEAVKSKETPDVAQLANPREGKPSASGMARLCRCPGSWRLEQMCPEPDESEAAAEGTMLHAHMEQGTLPEDAEQAEAVEWCREMEVQLRAMVWPDVDITEADCTREERLWASDGSYSGQADAVWVADGKALVVDYKFGRGEVESVVANHQLAALAVLVRRRHGVCEVYAAILQPRASRAVPPLVRYDEAALDNMERYLDKAIAAAAAPDAGLHTGELQCKYCRAAAICPAQLQLAQQVTAADVLAGWAAWTPAQKRLAYDTAQVAKKWAEKVVAKCEGDLAAGVPVDGLELGAGRTSFTVTDAQEAFTLLHEMPGVSAEEFVACCKVGITELDKLVHTKLKAAGASSTVKESKEWLRACLADVAECKTTKGSIKVSAK